MKLFLYCHHCGRKIYLASKAKTRGQLARQWGHNFALECPHCSNFGTYSVNQVYGEKTTQGNTLPVAVIGGLIGLVGGPAGVLAGGTIGGILGKTADDKELIEVRRFNNSNTLNS